MTRDEVLLKQVAKLEERLSEQDRAKQFIERQVTQLSALNRCARAVTRSLSLKEVVCSAHEQIQSLISPDMVVIYKRQGEYLIHQDPDRAMHPVDFTAPEEKKVGQCLCGLVARNGEPIYAIDIHKDDRCTLRECKDAGISSFAALPLFAGQDVVGTLGVASREKRDFSAQADFLQTLAAYVGIGLYNAELYEQIQHQAAELKELLDQQRETESKLKDEITFRKAIVEHAAEGLCVCSEIDVPPYLRFTVWNDRMSEITGYSMEDINRLGWHAVLDTAPDQLDRYLENVSRIFRGEDFREEELEILRSDGQRRIISISTSALSYKDDTPHVLAVIQDNTARVLAKETLLKAKKLEATGVLAGGIAHDFNNLLSVILGSISLAHEKIGDFHPISALLLQAEKSCFQAQDLTKKLITFSKGGMPVKRVGSIRRLLKDTSSLSLAGTSLETTEDVQERLWAVEFDEGQLKHAFNNVLANAVDASPEGARIDIRADNLLISSREAAGRLALVPGRYVRVTIRDYGAGISEENVSRIFDPYFSTKEKGARKGMGLGLTAAYAIVNNHGGHIAVQSKMGEGTTVMMYFPATDTPVETLEKADSKGAGVSRRILLMEDDEVLGELAQRMLQHLGYDPVLVRNDTEAVAAYLRERQTGKSFDAVILDLTIKGGVGGEKTLQHLQEIDPGVRAIVSSGHIQDPVIIGFKRYGFVAAMAKPYTLSGMKEVLWQVMKT